MDKEKEGRKEVECATETVKERKKQKERESNKTLYRHGPGRPCCTKCLFSRLFSLLLARSPLALAAGTTHDTRVPPPSDPTPPAVLRSVHARGSRPALPECPFPKTRLVRDPPKVRRVERRFRFGN